MRFFDKRRAPRVVVAVAGGLAIAGASLTAVAPAANAASISGFNSGQIGVPQQITLSGICPSSEITFTATYSNGATSSAPSVIGDINGDATAIWTPSQVGTVTAVNAGSTCTPYSQGANFQISQVGTTTTISAPNTAQVGQQTKITVTVQSNGGSTYQSPGQVLVTDQAGARITSMGLTNGPGAGQSYAYWWWTPKSTGNFTFQATYQPAPGSLSTGSASAVDTVNATPTGGTIALTAPPTMNQGVPTTLTATVYPTSTQGTVGFTLNGAPISGAIPITNGIATFQWTPNVAGQVTLGASYTTNAGGSGSTTDVVTISGAPAQSDQITLVQPGWGAWAPNGSYPMGNGSNFTFQASSLSGAPVTLAITGPCTVSGLTLQVNQGSGACNMTASSPGGNGYAPVTYGYSIPLVPGIQTAEISAPPSGRYKVGRVLVLESPGQIDTNAGQNISWKIKKKGRSNCKLLYPDNGSVTLRIQKKGECTVIGSAPGVAGQWQPFKTARKYRGR